MNSSLSNFLYEICSGKKKLCCFGTGQVAKTRGAFYAKWLGLEISCYCDNQLASGQRGRVYGKTCLSADALIRQKDRYACLVAIGLLHREEVGRQLDDAGFDDWIYIDDLSYLFAEDAFLRWYLGIDAFSTETPKPARDLLPKHAYEGNDRLVIYSCVTGGYDVPVAPIGQADATECVLVTDQPERDAAGWDRVIDIDTVLPSDIARDDFVLMNRYCKMHGSVLFPEARYSIYIDGKVHLKKDVRYYVDSISQAGFAMFKHWLVRDAYAESFVIASLGDYNDIVEDMKAQLRRYAKEGFPRQSFQLEGSVIARDHDSCMADKVMEDWFEEFRNGVRRDQLSIEYVLWKNGIGMKDFQTLPDEGNGDFEAGTHLHDKEQFGVERVQKI